MKNNIGMACVILASIAWMGAESALGQEGAPRERKALEEHLPDGFPIPNGAEMQAGESGATAVEARVRRSSAKDLYAYFRKELPARGFTIVAQNPPRVHNFDSPVILITQKAGESAFSVTIQTTQDGIATFIVN